MLIFLDIETTGIDKQTDHILEIHAEAWDDQLLTRAEVFSAILKPEGSYEMDAKVQDMHENNGLLDTVAERGREASAVFFELKEFFARYPWAQLVGRNVGTFDRAFLEAKHPGVSEALHYRSLDLSSLLTFFKLFPSPSGPLLPYSPSNHRAGGDVYGDLELLRTLRDWILDL